MGVLHEPAAALELLHRSPGDHDVRFDDRVGHLGRGRDLAHRGFDGIEPLRRRGPHVDLQVAALGNDVRACPAGDLADVDGDAGPPTVERVQVADEPRCLQDRVAPLLGFDARVGGPAVDGQARVEDALAGRHDVAVCAGTLEDQARIHVRGRGPDVRRRARRADLLVRVGDVHQPLERQPAGLADERLERVQPGEQPRLHVGHARAVGDPVVDAERPSRRGPGVEHGVHVPDQQNAGTARPAMERADDGVTEPPPRVGPSLDHRPELGHERDDPSADAVHALGGIRAAVDVHEPLEILEVRREVGGHGGAQGVELRVRSLRRGVGHGVGRHRPRVYARGHGRCRALAILPGPCD